MTQERLAELANITYEHLNHIENYHVLPSIYVLTRLAIALGYDRLSRFLNSDPYGEL